METQNKINSLSNYLGFFLVRCNKYEKYLYDFRNLFIYNKTLPINILIHLKYFM